MMALYLTFIAFKEYIFKLKQVHEKEQPDPSFQKDTKSF